VAAGSAVAAGTALGPRPAGASVPSAHAFGGVPDPPFHFTRSSPWWMQGNYAPVGTETTGTDLPVRGRLPEELTGLYVRNSANPAHGASPDWFLGDGMLHGVRLEAGRAAWFRNRWVRTPLVASGGNILDGRVIPGGGVNPSNTSVLFYAGVLRSLCEVGLPYAVSPDDLATVGTDDFGGRLTTAMTAHPKVDPATGRLHFFGYGFEAPFLTYHVADPNGTLVTSQVVDIPRPTMIQDFAVTDRDVVFWDLPVVFDMGLALEGRMPFTWQPSAGARVGVMPLGGPTSAIRWAEIEPGYVFHGTNAYRDGDDVVVDVGHLPSFYRPAGDPVSALTVRRWRIDTSGPAGSAPGFREEILSDRQIDLPTIDRRRTGLPYRYAFYVEAASQPGGVINWGGLVRRDTVGEAQVGWHPGRDRSAAEGLFVPAGPHAAEGEGWVLSFVYDWPSGTSELAVLDAGHLGEGPVATVALPQRVPFGFHGTWVPSVTD